MNFVYSNETFRGSNPTWANACVGENGAPGIIEYASGFAAAANVLLDRAIKDENVNLQVDTLVYPVCFTMRHAIELFLKSAAQNLIGIGRTRELPLPPFDHLGSHDLGAMWRYVKSSAGTTDGRLTELVDRLDAYVQNIADVDPTGQVFRYPFDVESKKHLVEVSVINFIVLKTRFNEAERLLLALNETLEALVEEYGWGTFTKKLSRRQLRLLATQLPPRSSWVEASFDDAKAALRAKYDLSSQDFSKALNLIQKRHEMAACIGMLVPIPALTLRALERFFDAWTEVNKIEDVIAPPPTRIVGSGEIEAAIRDYAAKDSPAERLAKELSVEEFAAIQALLEFESEAPVSEAFERVLSIHQRLAAHHAACAEEYVRALRKTIGKVRAIDRILYALDFLGQVEVLEAVIERYGLEPARARLLERSQRQKVVAA